MTAVSDMRKVPSIPLEWIGDEDSSRLADMPFSLRLGEADDAMVEAIARRHGLSKARIIRIMIHQALKGL